MSSSLDWFLSMWTHLLCVENVMISRSMIEILVHGVYYLVSGSWFNVCIGILIDLFVWVTICESSVYIFPRVPLWIHTTYWGQLVCVTWTCFGHMCIEKQLSDLCYFGALVELIYVSLCILFVLRKWCVSWVDFRFYWVSVVF